MLSFVDWRSIVTAALVRARDATARRYSAGGRLSHYEQLSNDVLARFENEALAKAAFLHGVLPSDRSLLDALPGVSAEVIGLLDDRNRLRALGSVGSNVRAGRREFVRPVMTNLLRAIRDRRAMLLFVFEQLRHMDEHGAIAAWQQRFVQAPEPFPLDAYAADPEDRFGDRVERAEFLRHVVAPVAEAIGLWQERNLAQNLALLQVNETLFLETVARVLAEMHDAPAAFARAAAEATGAVVEWQWRHVDSIVRRQRLDRSDRKAWRVERAGYVLVRCSDGASCYAALAGLHRQFDHVPEALRDLTSRESRASGYAAIHTRVEIGGSRGAGYLVPVHIMEDHAAHQRLASAGAEQLHVVAANNAETAADSLRVFAYDGRVYYIPLDGTVLNFAYAVYRGFLAHLRGATVNDRPVSVLQRLRDGDVVWLDIAATFEPLPDEWRSTCPKRRGGSWSRRTRTRSAPRCVTTGPSPDFVLAAILSVVALGYATRGAICAGRREIRTAAAFGGAAVVALVGVVLWTAYVVRVYAALDIITG